MRIKIIDLPTYETDPDIIAEHLQKVLKEIRKKKLARDLIGEDERSSEFEADAFDDFAETLSSGTDLTMFDKRRIADRASKLAKARVRVNSTARMSDVAVSIGRCTLRHWRRSCTPCLHACHSPSPRNLIPVLSHQQVCCGLVQIGRLPQRLSER